MECLEDLNDQFQTLGEKLVLNYSMLFTILSRGINVRCRHHISSKYRVGLDSLVVQLGI